MAEIKAFKGLRYTEKAGEIKSLCCPPYDIISYEQSRIYHSANPYNVIKLELPRSLSDDPSVDVYAKSGEFLRSWIDGGFLKNDDEDSIYVYEMEFEINGARKNVIGFIPLVKVEDFSKGIILPHEETLSKDKSDRFNLMEATGCNFSQIYSLYSDESGEIRNMLSEVQKTAPASFFTDDDGVIHKLWAVSEITFCKKITALMAEKKLYIADGHHRYETALKYRDVHSGEAGSSDYVPMMLVDMADDGLVILPTHRIVRDLEKYNQDEIILKCGKYFNIMSNLNRADSETALAKAFTNNEKAFVLYSGDGNYTLLKLKDVNIMKEFMPDKGDALRNLDVSILHTLVLERIFGIDRENMANQVNLTYTRSADEAVSAIDNGKGNCAFLLNPCGVGEIGGVVSTGGKMPQKSTYFYPKLTTGLVMNQIKK
ncbi:MAG: DUF1015 domain-containing protein [Oscillospiraceae bacterium]|jgi:uncharacterized protein (DUF1015 family)|nr:DUF1015 domain-containing protein [Oscillospiraceae bacterium]